MKPLSPEAKRALGALSAQEPSASDEARVRKNLERTLGVVLPTAVVGVSTVATGAGAATVKAATTAASSASMSTVGLTALGTGAKVTLFVVALGAGALGTVVVRSAVVPAKAPPAVVQLRAAPVAVVEVPVEAEPPVVTNAPAPEAPTVDSVPVPKSPSVRKAPVVAATVDQPETPEVAPPTEPMPTPPPVTPPAPPTLSSAETQSDFARVVELEFPTCDAAVERRSAAAARRLLNEDRAQHALLLLSEYQRQCVSGQWSDEAWRVRLSSLCKLDRNKEAATLFEWFTSEYPKRRQAIESELRMTCEPSVLGE